MTDTAAERASSDALATRNTFSDDALSGIKTLDDAIRVMNEAGIVAESTEDYGNGFKILPTKDKTQLVNVPFLIMEWRFSDGENGEFVSAMIVTKDNRKLILNDGSTGIYKQLRTITDKREKTGHATPRAGLVVQSGLTVSEYDKEVDGKLTKARTFYLAN